MTRIAMVHSRSCARRMLALALTLLVAIFSTTTVTAQLTDHSMQITIRSSDMLFTSVDVLQLKQDFATQAAAAMEIEADKVVDVQVSADGSGTKIICRVDPTLTFTPLDVYPKLQTALGTVNAGMLAEGKVFFGFTATSAVEVWCANAYRADNCDGAVTNTVDANHPNDGSGSETLGIGSVGIICAIIFGLITVFCFVWFIVCNPKHSIHDDVCKMHCFGVDDMDRGMNKTKRDQKDAKRKRQAEQQRLVAPAQ